MPYTRDDVAKLIDHTLLKPEATHSQVRELVEEANELGVCSVCVSPSLLPLPFDLGDVKLAVVCGFPSVDMVGNLAWAAGNEFEKVEADIRAVREAMPRAVLKAIIESAALSDEQIVAVCEAAKAAGADFVKTSTGFHPSGGASVHAVALMKATAGETMQVKASGGIRDGKFAAELLDAGATRLGLSASAKVLDTL